MAAIARLDWWSLGYSPDESVDLLLRPSGLDMLEHHGLLAFRPGQVFDFVEGMERFRELLNGAIHSPITLSLSAENYQALVTVYRLAAELFQRGRRSVQMFVPKHGHQQVTEHVLHPGDFVPEDWEEFGLLRSISSVLEGMSQRGDHEVRATRNPVRHDEAFARLQGARWVAAQTIDAEWGELAEPVELWVRTAFHRILLDNLGLVPPPVLEMAQDL